jgi:L-ascorbate metabolism protein UlaG (beta-lactamase superfamily)
MQLTKYTHSCVRLDDGDRSLVLDPGVFGEISAALDGVQAVLITHEHVDHIDMEKVGAALKADPRMRLYAPAGVTGALAPEHAEQVVVVRPGEDFEAAGFPVRVFGGQHAVIHPQLPVIANNGYFIADSIYHPGDSFAVPPVQVQTLLLPTNAPWSKGSEVIDFAIAVRAPQTINVHDSLITDVYAGLIEGHLKNIAGPFGVEHRHLDPGQTISA